MRSRWHPAVVHGRRVGWHHFIVTEMALRSPRAIGSEICVAYETTELDGTGRQIVTTTEVWEHAVAIASWVLAPAEVTAFRNLIRRDDGSVGPQEAAS